MRAPHSRTRTISLLLGIGLTTASAACHRTDAPARYGPGVALCLEMVEERLGPGEVVEVRVPRLGEATLRLRRGEVESHAACRWEGTPTGRLRLTAVVIDGQAVPDLALLVRNADLLLEELRDSRGAPTS